MPTERPESAVSYSTENKSSSARTIPGAFSLFGSRLKSELTEHLQSTAEVERLWLAARILIVLVGVFAAVVVLNGTATATAVYAGSAIVLITNLFLLLMLRRGMTMQVAIAGLLIDNLVILGMWSSSLGLNGETRPPNDLYLAFFPVFTLWSSRLGFKLGVPYTLIWVGWIAWTVSTFLPAGGYETEQLPIRVAFLILTSVLGMWTARLLKSQKRIADESSMRAKALQDLDRAKDQFIATVSHELKTPMAAILGFSRLLRADMQDSHLRERIEIIERNGERLSVLIDDLVDVSRIQSERMPLHTGPIEVSEFVNKTVSDLNSLVALRGQVITVACSDGQNWIHGDDTRLAQVLTNLITNSSKYSSTGSEIRVQSHVEDDVLSLTVSDSGEGISDEDQELLFQPFYRTKHARNSSVPGTGLGLFISKRIVELHGGELTLNSEQGKGTTVVVRLPNVSDSPPAEVDDAPQFSNAFDDTDELEEAG